jgi:hypothetical protein
MVCQPIPKDVEVGYHGTNHDLNELILTTNCMPNGILETCVLVSGNEWHGTENNKGILTKPFGFVDLSSLIH